MSSKKNTNKAAILYNLIGDYLPSEAIRSLDPKAIEKLVNSLGQLNAPNSKEEKDVLEAFTRFLSSSKKKSPNTSLPQEAYKNIESIIDEGLKQTVSHIQLLKKRKRSELALIIQDEPPRIIAMVMCFADADEISHLVEEFPSNTREQILMEINKIDFHSEEIRDELERFLKFKIDLIQSNSLISKIQNRGGRKAAEILARLSPNLSIKLLSKIQEVNPEYAENINKHFYTFKDLLKVDRTNLSKFLSSFNPIVVAFALKGVETYIAEEILNNCEPWLSKSIRLEMDCMGPVTLAEIEESQKGIIEQLHKSIDSGEIKLWKDK